MFTIWTGMPAWICMSPAPARIAPNRSAGEEDADRVGAAQQRNRDRVEADADVA